MHAVENSGYHFLRKGIIQDMTEKASLLKWIHETSLSCGIQMCGTLTSCERGLTVSWGNFVLQPPQQLAQLNHDTGGGTPYLARVQDYLMTAIN